MKNEKKIVGQLEAMLVSTLREARPSLDGTGTGLGSNRLGSTAVAGQVRSKWRTRCWIQL